MASNYTEWSFQLYDLRLNRPIDDDSGVCNVLTADDPSEVTIYSNDTGTSKSNPTTMSNGEFRFFTDVSTTSVDLSIQTASGQAFFVQGFTPSQHRINVNPEKMENCLVVPFQVVGASETVVDTGFDILSNMLVKDVFIHVTTIGTGALLDIGTSTDSDGFLDGIAATTTGYPITALEESSVSGSSLLGALLAPEASNNYARGLHKRANATSGANIVYTNTTSSSTAGEGYVYITYLKVPTTGG